METNDELRQIKIERNRLQSEVEKLRGHRILLIIAIGITGIVLGQSIEEKSSQLRHACREINHLTEDRSHRTRLARKALMWEVRGLDAIGACKNVEFGPPKLSEKQIEEVYRNTADLRRELERIRN